MKLQVIHYPLINANISTEHIFYCCIFPCHRFKFIERTPFVSRTKSDKERKKRRAQNKQSESAAGNYFQAGTFRLPGKRSTPQELYDNADFERGHKQEDTAETDLDDVARENRYNSNKDKATDPDKISIESDKDSGKGTASVEDSEAAPSEHDVINDAANDDDVVDTSGIAHVDEVGVDVERMADPDFVNREKEKIKSRAEQTSVIPGRGYIPRYRRRTEPLEPLFEFGEDETPKSSFKKAREVFNY